VASPTSVPDVPEGGGRRGIGCGSIAMPLRCLGRVPEKGGGAGQSDAAAFGRQARPTRRILALDS
jgi:hypothetical protein